VNLVGWRGGRGIEVATREEWNDGRVGVALALTIEGCVQALNPRIAEEVLVSLAPRRNW